MESKALVNILAVALPFLYAALTGLYGLIFYRSAPVAERLRRPALLVTLIVHFLYIGLRTITFDHPPITSVFELMSMLALCIAIAYTYIEWRTRTRSTGVFILTLAFAFQTVSSIFVRDIVNIPDYLHSLLLGFHVSTALLGYTAMSLSAAYGFLYLMLYHEIKSSRFGMVYNRLPSLEVLEIMSYKAAVFGCAMLTVAIGIGLVWLPRVFASFSYWDPKLVGTILIWALYAVGLAAKRRLGLQGRKMMVISLVAFTFVFLSMTVINLYLSAFHSFH